MYLLDTNIWLELLLDQAKAGEVRTFLLAAEPGQLALTEFSLYSIGVILTRLNKDDVFEDFISDTIEDGGVMRIRLDSADLKRLLQVRQQYQLDFDDAYQYVAAAKYDYTLISFDSDFDRTERGRRTPGEMS